MKQAGCPFCEHSNDKVVIYEDSLVYAIISTSPINQYHAMVIPRVHYQHFTDLPDEIAARIFLVAKRLSGAIRVVCNPDAITHLSDDDLTGSGFNLVSHYKLHIIPRHRDDGVEINWNRKPDPGPEARAQLAEEIRRAL